jgi:DNA helicase HerA-like ATPase
MSSALTSIAEAAPAERRSAAQPVERLMGRVISCDGAYATVAASTRSSGEAQSDYWTIGKLISITVGDSRVVGLVYKLKSTDKRWSEEELNTLHALVELVGEINDNEKGEAVFSRGITHYPPLGALAHRIRSRDLVAVHMPYTKQSVVVGTLSQDDNIPATVDIESMLSRHFAIVGTTGTGKSSALALLLRKSLEARPDLRILLFDPHNEFSTAFPDKANVLTPDTLELPFWLFQHEELAEVVFRGKDGVEEEIDALRDLVPEARAKFNAKTNSNGKLVRRAADLGNISADTPVPYRMSDLFAIIDEEIGMLEGRHDRLVLKSLKSRLDTLVNDPRYRFMFSARTIDDNMTSVLGNIFRVPTNDRPITCLQLAGVPSEVVNSVISVLCRMAFDLAMWSGGACGVLVVCEEAHRYVPQDRSLGFGPTRQSIARIAKEGRKYGVHLGVVTQRPGELDPTILSQCSTIFSLRLANDRDQDIICSAIADSSASTISFLSSIGNREAIAFGEGIATPMRMMFQELRGEFVPGAPLYTAGRDSEGRKTNIDLEAIISKMRGVHEKKRRSEEATAEVVNLEQ